MACDTPPRITLVRDYTQVRPTTRWRVREEPASGRARFDQAIGLLPTCSPTCADAGAFVTRTPPPTSPRKRCRLLAYRDAPDIGDYALLMYRIAHNVVLEHWRTRHRRHANAHVALDLIAPLAADGAHVDQIADARRIMQHLTPTRCPHYRPDAARPSSSTASTASPTRKWPQPWASRSRWWKSTSAAHWPRAGPLCSDVPGCVVCRMRHQDAFSLCCTRTPVRYDPQTSMQIKNPAEAGFDASVTGSIRIDGVSPRWSVGWLWCWLAISVLFFIRIDSSKFSGVWIHIPTCRIIVERCAVGRTAIVRLHISAISAVITIDTGLRAH